MTDDTLVIVPFPIDQTANFDTYALEGGTLSPCDPIPSGSKIIALLPADHVVVQWIDMGDLPPKQAEAAAKLKAINASIGGADDLHAAALHCDDGSVLVAVMAAPLLETGLKLLKARGIDPDILLPAPLVLAEPETGFASGIVFDRPVLRGVKFAATDDEALRSILIGDAPLQQVQPEALAKDFLGVLARPIANLREGRFAKKGDQLLATSRQWRLAGWLIGTTLLASLLIALTAYFSFDRGVSNADAKALELARSIVPGASDIDTVEQQVTDEQVRKGIVTQSFGAVLATLYAVVQDSPGVTLREIRYAPDGTLSATLAAPQTDAVNVALIALQEKGYKITAVPRQDSSGLSLAEITMRPR